MATASNPHRPEVVGTPAARPGLRVRFLQGPIDPPTWAEAQWHGVGYVTDPAGSAPPGLGLAFLNPGPARRIFRSWQSRFGPAGADDVLRVAIVEGPAPAHPPGYFVHLGADPEWAAQESGAMPSPGPWDLVSGSAVHRAIPPAGTVHLAAFKREYARYGRYTLVPILRLGGRFEAAADLAIDMTRLWFRTAATVGTGDIDRDCFDREPGPGRHPSSPGMSARALAPRRFAPGRSHGSARHAQGFTHES